MGQVDNKLKPIWDKISEVVEDIGNKTMKQYQELKDKATHWSQYLKCIKSAGNWVEFKKCNGEDKKPSGEKSKALPL